MAYDVYKAVKALYDLKGQWDAADKAGDDTKKQTAAGDAVKWYQELRDNGYGSVADELQASNYTQAKGTHDYYAKTGRTKTRPYFYDLGKAYNLTEADVDKIIGYDDSTGEITLGGKNIGRPDSVVDGVSYWSDTSVLDKAFSDYAERSGLTRSKDALVNQDNEYLSKKYKEEYDRLIGEDPFETDTGKAILAKYDLAGLQGRNNELAGGAASNGGNIDSFAAANALRQQSALVNQGQMVALEAHQKKIDNARAMLADMGVNIDRVFNQDETSKNNQVSRDIAVGESLGFATDGQLKASSSLWNADGTLADTDMDYRAHIKELAIKHDAATTAEEKQSYALALKLLEMARNDKIDKTGSKEPKSFDWINAVETANMKITKAQIESAEKLVGLNADANIKQINAQGKVTKDLYDKGVTPDGKPIEPEPTVEVYTKPSTFDTDIKTIRNGGGEPKVVNGVDIFGADFLEAYFKKYEGGSDVEDFIDFVELNSPVYHVDLKQLESICRYLEIPPSLVISKFEDSDEQYNYHQMTWADGVKKKAESK